MIRVFALDDAYRTCSEYVKKVYVQTHDMYKSIMREPSSFFASDEFRKLVLYMCQKDLKLIGYIDEFSGEYGFDIESGLVVTDSHYIGDLAQLKTEFENYKFVPLTDVNISNEIAIVSIRSEAFYAKITSPSSSVVHILFTKDISNECVGYLHSTLALEYPDIADVKTGLFLSLWRFIMKGYGIDFMCLHSDARPVLYCEQSEIDYMLTKIFHQNDICFYEYTESSDLKLISNDAVLDKFINLGKASDCGEILASQNVNLNFRENYAYERLVYWLNHQKISFDVLKRCRRLDVQDL